MREGEWQNVRGGGTLAKGGGAGGSKYSPNVGSTYYVLLKYSLRYINVGTNS